MRVGGEFCPGVLHAVPAKDGLLIRVRVPGGLIQADQLKAVAGIASAFADGCVEITSRANLQLRAIQDRNLDPIVERITSAGLLPSPRHDRVRNIVTSPLAGVDGEEIVDPRSLIHELDRQLLAESSFASLHPKFSFAIYGGARRFSLDRDDISLEAVNLNSVPHFHLSIGGASSGFVVQQADAVDCMLTAAKLCIELAAESGLPVRGRTVRTIPGAMTRMVDTLSRMLTPSPAAPPSCSIDEALLGIYPTTQYGRASIVPSVPLGRLTAEQAICIADAANAWEGDLRLAPWRGIVLASIPQSAVANIVGRLHSMGLSCDGQDGFRGIAACAGSDGCEASLADVRGDAELLARRLAGRIAPSGWTVNLSGCEKQCGRRHGATAQLVAGPLGYTLTLEEHRAASDCSRDFALGAIASLHENLLSEVADR